MLPIYIFIIAVVFILLHLAIIRNWQKRDVAKTSLLYLLFFNIGVMGLLAFYAHVFNADQTAESIGWQTGSPFQFEMGMANLAVGVLGILCLKYRDLFWNATIIAVSILYIGCFIGHIIQYTKGDIAVYNIGTGIIFNDLVLPLILLSLLGYLRLGHYETR